jgi:hypothetical protein
MSLLEFRSNLLGGGARPNQFKVELTLPGIAQNAAEAGRRAQFLCTATSLPASTIGGIPVSYRGRTFELAGERQFAPWQVRIINDTDFMIRNSLESWSDRINNLTQNTGLTAPLTYTSDMSVHQLDRNGNTLKTYKFIGVWPSQIGEIQLAFGDDNQIETFDVQFTYIHYETDFSSNISVSVNTPIGGVTVPVLV